MLIPIDIEDALRIDVGAVCDDITTGAPPLPESFEGSLPFALFERTGGDREDRVIDTHYVSVDVYAHEWADAQQAANKLVGVVCELQDTNDLSVHYLSSDFSVLPYNNPDPRHAELARVTFSIAVSTRAIEI